MRSNYLQTLSNISSSYETAAVLSSYLRNVDTDVGEKIDYSKFANHTFFNSAYNKFNIFIWKLYNQYDRTFTWDEYYTWYDTLSGYEKYALTEYPSYRGYFYNSASDCGISGTDYENKLALTASSNDLSIEFCFNVTSSENVQYILKRGQGQHFYQVYISGASYDLAREDRFGAIIFDVSSGTTAFSASYYLPESVFDHGNHIAFCYSSASISTSIYLNYNLVTTTGSARFGNLIPSTGSVYVACSASEDPTAITKYITGSLDELRVWNSYRSAEQISQYGMRHVRQEPELIFYLKFNEPYYVTQDNSVFEQFYDYSKRPIDCRLIGSYNTNSKTSGVLTDATGSNIITDNYSDPIVLSDYSDVQTYVNNNWNSGSAFDKQNRNLITNYIPQSYLIEEEQKKTYNLTNLVYLIARQLDEMKLHIQHFGNFNRMTLDSYDVIPYKSLESAIELFGLGSFDNFPLADPSELFKSYYVNSEKYYALREVNETFWRALLNNLIYIYKTKGTRESIKSFFHCLGLDERTFSVKDYSSQYTYPVTNSYVTLNNTRYSRALTFMTSSNTGSFVYVSASQLPYNLTNSFAIEALVAFKEYSYWESGTFYETIVSSQPYILTGSIWGVNQNYLPQAQSSSGEYGLVFFRDALTSSYGKISLYASSSVSGSTEILSTSQIPIFDGEYYNIAYRRSGSNLDTYVFLDVKKLDTDSIKHLCSVSTGSSFESLTGSAIRQNFIVGAFSGSRLFNWNTTGAWTETKQCEVRVWDKCISAEELAAHCMNYTSIGMSDPESDYSRLIGHWIYDDGDSSDATGQIYPITNYSYYKTSLDATGSGFLTSSTNNFIYDSFNYNYLCPDISLKWNTNKVQYALHDDILERENNINVFTVEFNLIDALNEDIIRVFSDIKKFSNLVGNPALAYRNVYNLNSTSFYYDSRITKNISYTNYFNNLSWVDRFYFNIIEKLIPARCYFSGEEKVIESSILERSKLISQINKKDIVNTRTDIQMARPFFRR